MSRKIEVLDGIAERLRKGWCKGAYAKKADGTSTPWTDPNATQFCLVGALRLETYLDPPGIEKEVTRLLMGGSPEHWLPRALLSQFNDDVASVDSVLDLIAKARTKAEAEEVVCRRLSQ